MTLEYRVRWRREGRRLSTRIYQAWDGAYHKAMRVKALEAIKDESNYRTMPPLAEAPTIEVREVGAWGAHPFELGGPSESTIADVRHWACDPPPEAGPW